MAGVYKLSRKPDADVTAADVGDMTPEEQEGLLRRVRNHKGCNGRGFIGYKGVAGSPIVGPKVPCNCLRRAMARIIKDRLKQHDGFKVGWVYGDMGRYIGVEKSQVDDERFHAFESVSLKDQKGAPLRQHIAVTDKERLAEVRKTEIEVIDNEQEKLVGGYTVRE